MTYVYYGFIGLLGNVVQHPSTEFIDLFYSCNSKWLVGPIVMDHNSLSNPSELEFYTCSQSAGVAKYSLELYGAKRYMTTTVANAVINIDKNITELRVTLTDDQQVPSTISQPLVNEKSSTYPKITRINVHSQMTRLLAENDKKIRYSFQIRFSHEVFKIM